MKKAMILLIKSYQYLASPWLGHSCRFHPSCSHYAIEAIQLHGAVKGGFLSLRRVLRCHPWCAGGLDPVPGSSQASSSCQCSEQQQ